MVDNGKDLLQAKTGNARVGKLPGRSGPAITIDRAGRNTGRGDGIDTNRAPTHDEATAGDAVFGACMLVRQEVFATPGGMDECYPLRFEDPDLFARFIESGRMHLVWAASRSRAAE